MMNLRHASSGMRYSTVVEGFATVLMKKSHDFPLFIPLVSSLDIQHPSSKHSALRGRGVTYVERGVPSHPQMCPPAASPAWVLQLMWLHS